jgi:hypothetical protein
VADVALQLHVQGKRGHPPRMTLPRPSRTTCYRTTLKSVDVSNRLTELGASGPLALSGMQARAPTKERTAR